MLSDTNIQRAEFLELIKNTLKQVKDPELKLDVCYLGLIRDIKILPTLAIAETNKGAIHNQAAQSDENEKVDCEIVMTLTSAGCPFAGSLVEQVENAVRSLEFVNSVKVNLQLNPPWQPPEHIKDLFGWS